VFGAALAAVMILLAIAARASAAAGPPADGSYLASASGGLELALVVRDDRIEAYACDGKARRAFFSGRAGRLPLTLHSAAGDALTLRPGGHGLAARLALAGAEPRSLTARKGRAALFTTTIRPNGAVTGTARGGGVLGAQLSATGLVGALAFPGSEPHAFTDGTFARAALSVDGQAVAFPPEVAAQALQGGWRWIVTPNRIVGATRKPANSFDIEQTLNVRIPAGTRFIAETVHV
jgi:hypothetical protein